MVLISCLTTFCKHKTTPISSVIVEIIIQFHEPPNVASSGYGKISQVSDVIFYYSALSKHSIYSLASSYTLPRNMTIAKQSKALIENPGGMIKKNMKIWQLRPCVYSRPLARTGGSAVIGVGGV